MALLQRDQGAAALHPGADLRPGGFAHGIVGGGHEDDVVAVQVEPGDALGSDDVLLGQYRKAGQG